MAKSTTCWMNTKPSPLNNGTDVICCSWRRDSNKVESPLFKRDYPKCPFLRSVLHLITNSFNYTVDGNIVYLSREIRSLKKWSPVRGEKNQYILFLWQHSQQSMVGKVTISLNHWYSSSHKVPKILILKGRIINNGLVKLSRGWNSEWKKIEKGI